MEIVALGRGAAKAHKRVWIQKFIAKIKPLGAEERELKYNGIISKADGMADELKGGLAQAISQKRAIRKDEIMEAVAAFKGVEKSFRKAMRMKENDPRAYEKYADFLVDFANDWVELSYLNRGELIARGVFPEAAKNAADEAMKYCTLAWNRGKNERLLEKYAQAKLASERAEIAQAVLMGSERDETPVKGGAKA